MYPVGLICQVCVQSSDDPSLLLRPLEKCRQILAPRSHLPVQGRVGQLGVQVVEVVGEEHHLAPHPARVHPELLEAQQRVDRHRLAEVADPELVGPAEWAQERGSQDCDPPFL